MIDIKFSTKPLYKLTLKGHAEYNNEGNDIVCASVSALVSTLAIYLDGKANIRLNAGDSSIECEVTECDKAVFDAIVVGLEVLANTYKKNLRFSRGEG